MTFTPFGCTLRKYALQKAGRHNVAPGLLRYLSPLNPAMYDIEKDASPYLTHKLHGKADSVAEIVVGKWGGELNIIFHVYAHATMQQWINAELLRRRTPNADPKPAVLLFDEFWREVDTLLWQAARKWDPIDSPGRVSAAMGVWAPNDPHRPSFVNSLLKMAVRATLVEYRTPAPAAPTEEADPVVPSFEPLRPEEKAQSAHAYLSTTDKPKTKPKKTRSTAEGHSAPAVIVPAQPELTLDDFPDILPSNFKLPRKLYKVRVRNTEFVRSWFSFYS